MACVIYSTIFLESTIGIPFYSDLSIEDANYFQIIGSSTVLDNLEIWNINATFMDTNEIIIPTNYYLGQNYPNPFNPTTAISFSIPEKYDVNVRIYNMLGQLVHTLVNESLEAGNYSYNFNASSLSSGTYIYRVSAGNNVETRKMILMK